MAFLIGLLTVVLVLDCVVLILLVLIQLPKKEAGAGLAFGGAATDALFGAGSGNTLTKITKYAAILFFGLAILLGLLGAHSRTRSASDFQRELEKQSREPAAPLTPPSATAPAPAATPAGTNLLTLPPAAPPPATPAPAPTTPTPTNPAPQ